MKRVCEMNQSELNEFYAAAKKEYEACKAKGLSLNMARGKPSAAQLELSNELLTILKGDNCIVDGIDARNYGTLEGLPSCRRMFADILGVDAEEVFAAGSASLTLMYDTIAKAVTHGLLHSEKPWAKLDKVKFLCPVPGYDRHFTICESFGIEMINVPMTAEGPDMDMVEELIKDKDVKGMWCVPKYSNPEGIIYSEATIRRIAAMKPAASDFVLMWDNAYCVHEFDGEYVPFPNILEYCREAGNPDMVIEFASTSKVTLPGAGISIGLTRLFYVLGEQGMLNPDLPTAPADVLILPMTEDLSAAISLATLLRENGIRTQLHCEDKKFKQKISYADKLGIPYVIFLGEDEISQGVAACKDMATGEQTKLSPAATVYRIKAGLAEREKGAVILE